MIVTQAIFGINVAVFLGMLFAGVSILDNPAGRDLVNWGANFGPYTVSGEWWRLLTCVFVHGSFVHIAINMWCLWDLGSLAESLYGHWTFGALYLICGVIASLASVGWNLSVLSVGASGAIFGLAGALIASYYLGEFSLPRSAFAGTLRSIVIFVGYSLVAGPLLGGMFSARVDNAAHVGGLVSGLILGALIAKVAPQRNDVLPRIGVFLFGALLAFGGIAWLDHARGYDSRIARAQEFLARGDTEHAISQLQSALRRNPGAIDDRVQLARIHARKGDYTNAEAELKRVLAVDPKNESALSSVGVIYLKQQRLPEAQHAFEQVLSFNPNSMAARSGLAGALSAQGKDREALQELTALTKLNPGAEGAHYNMGLMQARLKMYDEAILSFREEQDVSGDDAVIENALAEAYAAKGMKQDAEAARKKAEELQKQQ